MAVAMMNSMQQELAGNVKQWRARLAVVAVSSRTRISAQLQRAHLRELAIGGLRVGFAGADGDTESLVVPRVPQVIQLPIPRLPHQEMLHCITKRQDSIGVREPIITVAAHHEASTYLQLSTSDEAG
jgi:hypothetical protein